MAERPAKRQRTSIHDSSESEHEHTSSKKSHGRNSRPVNANLSSKTIPYQDAVVGRNRPTNVKKNASINTTPEKVKKTVNRKPELPSKSLHSFFSRATDEQRWRKKSATPEPDLSYTASLDDDITDDDDDSLSHFSSQQSDIARDATDRIRRRSITPSSTASSSQRRFVRPGIAATTRSALSRSVTHSSIEATTDVKSNDQKPWADRFGPDTLDELAVHKKKVGDVQQWLENVLSGRERQRLLVLKGPAGSGKTTTISLLAQMRNVQIVPWQNPVVPDTGSSSVIQQFNDFLDRGGEYEALDMHDEYASRENGLSPQVKIMLVEEFPLTMTRSSKSLDEFRSALLTYLAASDQSKLQKGQPSSVKVYPPVIMIISETLLSSSTALSDSFTAHRLLGTELTNHPLVNTVEFNPVAATFIAKALDLVVKKEARFSARRRIPGPAVMATLAEIGDVRSAINSLEFFCARGDQNADWSGTVAGRMKKKDTTPLTEMEKNTLRLVSQRESTLDMFHATGKIVYNKREDPKVHDTRTEPPPKPPDHLMYLHVPQISQVDIDALLGETGTDIQTFVSTLHENYVLSCNGDAFCDSFDACAQTLSDSDVLNPDRRSLSRSAGVNTQVPSINTQSGNSEMLRQDELSFNTACRGLLFSLPYPVHRAVPPNVRKQDAFKMFYPASLRIWKPTEEMHDLIALFRRHGPGSRNLSDLRSTIRAEEGGVASWRSRELNFTTSSSAGNVDHKETTEPDDEPPSRLIISSEEINVLDILPYSTKISNSPVTNDLALLKKITQFRGSSTLSATTDIPDDDEEPPPEPNRPSATSLSAKVEAAHNSILSYRQRQQQPYTNGQPPTSGQVNGRNKAIDVDPAVVEKLYISDDDIIDD